MLSTSLPRCHFIRMCAELRIRVYRYLFEDATALVRNIHDFKTCDLVGTRLWSTGCNKSILSTCRMIHVESKPILAGSMLLIICSSWWKPQASFKVYYQDMLSSYLPNSRVLRLEDNYGSRYWIFDTTRLPNLESLTLVGAGVFLTSTFEVLHDTAAVQLVEGKEDQHVIEFHLGLEDGTGLPVSPKNSPYLPWLVELLKRPGRTFRIFREHNYELLITKFEADAVSGRLQRWMRLKFDADTGRLVRTISAVCTLSGQWNAATVDLCASSNRQAGVTVPQKFEHTGIEVIFPI